MRLLQHLLLVLVATIAAISTAHSQERVALVIGNAAYLHATPLRNPAADAKAMARTLQTQGYLVQLGIDLSWSVMTRFLAEFARRAEEADVVLIYFTGHAIALSNHNYLLPVDVKLETEHDVELSSVRLDAFLKELSDRRRGKPTIVLLDACRENPWPTSPSPTLNAQRGLAEETPERGTLIAYATSPGQVALDNASEQSVFTAALLRQLAADGAEVRNVLQRVRSDVVTATAGRQVPWDTSTLLQEVYITPPKASAPATRSSPASSASSSSGEDRRKAASYEDALRKAVADAEAQRRAAEEARRSADAKRMAAEMEPQRRAAADTEAQRRAAREEASRKADAERRAVDEEARRKAVAEAEARQRADAERPSQLPAQSPLGEDALVWRTIESSSDVGQLNGFIRAYPTSIYAQLAGARLAQIRQQTEATLASVQAAGDNLALAIQRELARAGCASGSLDGIWGPQTERALQTFAANTKTTVVSSRPELATLSALSRFPNSNCGSTPPSSGPTATAGITRFATLEAPETATTARPFPVTFTLNEKRSDDIAVGQASVQVKPADGGAPVPDGRLPLKLDPDREFWDIDVDLSAAGFAVADDRWTTTIRLPRTGDSTPARFVLTPRSTTSGIKWISVRLWHEGRLLGSASRPIEVRAPEPASAPAPSRSMPKQGLLKTPDPLAPQPSTAAETYAPRPIELLPAASSPATDLDVLIEYDNPDTLGPGRIVIRTPHRRGEVSARINTPPALRTYLEKEYARFVKLGSEAQEPGSNKSPAFAVNAVRAVGATLYREYVPEPLKEAIQSLSAQGKLLSIQISSNSPVMPWEIVLPDRRPGTGRPEFLGITYRLARWSLRSDFKHLEDPIHDLSLSELHALAPSYKGADQLPAQRRELDALRRLKGFRLHKDDFAALQGLMRTKISGVVHFLGHGEYAPGSTGDALYSIKLADRDVDPATFQELARQATIGNPFFFFNACNVGGSRSYGGFVQGWGPVVLASGASGFVGGQWLLLDEAAADFSKAFYDRLGHTNGTHGLFVADVLREIRRRFYETGDPTFLAYAFYGSANLQIKTLAAQ